MSYCIQTKHITSNLYKKIKNELIISVSGTGEVIELFDTEFERKTIEGDLLHLPFAWARNNISSIESKQVHSTALADTGFIGKLRTEQEEVRNEAYKNLQETGSTIISAKPGFGKTICTIALSTILKLINHITIGLFLYIIFSFACLLYISLYRLS
jgi:hypothetical protein